MGKYNHLIYLKQTKARSRHICSDCGKGISPGKTYWKEDIKDKYLHKIGAKKYCSTCYEKHVH